MDDKICKHCKKGVKTSLDCEYCCSAFHPSCARQAKATYLQENQRESVNCCQPTMGNNLDERKIRSIFKDLLTEFLGPFKKGIEEDMAEIKKSSQTVAECVKEQKKAIQNIATDVKQLRDDNTALKTEIEALKLRMSTYETNVKTPIQDFENLTSEVNERARRASNIIIFNIPQSKSAVLQERIDNDRDHVQNLLSTLGLAEENHKILKVLRIGRLADDKIRPLKVVFTCPDVVYGILRNCNKLNSTKIRISKDLTKLQQETYKKIRDEYHDRLKKGESVALKYRGGFPVIEMVTQMTGTGPSPKNTPAPH